MDFSLTEDQEALRDGARALLRGECPPELVRAHADDPSLGRALFDRHLAEWVAVSAEMVDLSLFLTEAGRVLLPGPFFATSALFAPLLRLTEIDPALAEAVDAGGVSGTVAVAGASGVWEPNEDPVRTFVLELDQVDRVAVVGSTWVSVIDLAESPLSDARYIETMDTTRRSFQFTCPPSLLADRIEIGPAVLADFLLRATTSVAAELVGVARWLLETTLAYAAEREQFGQPIGSFQGLQWKLVEMALLVERADAAVAYAAMTIDAADADRVRATHVAKAAAGRAARLAARQGLQIHGGIGYTFEHDLHRYLRRAYASDDLLGDAAWHHDRLGELALN